MISSKAECTLLTWWTNDQYSKYKAFGEGKEREFILVKSLLPSFCFLNINYFYKLDSYYLGQAKKTATAQIWVDVKFPSSFTWKWKKLSFQITSHQFDRQDFYNNQSVTRRLHEYNPSMVFAILEQEVCFMFLIRSRYQITF